MFFYYYWLNSSPSHYRSSSKITLRAARVPLHAGIRLAIKTIILHNPLDLKGQVVRYGHNFYVKLSNK